MARKRRDPTRISSGHIGGLRGRTYRGASERHDHRRNEYKNNLGHCSLGFENPTKAAKVELYSLTGQSPDLPLVV
jgi:hypothetical protein